MRNRMTIEAWYKHQAKSRNRYNPTDYDERTMPLGIRMDGIFLREPDGSTRLAEFVRHGERPLVRLVLPNQLTIGRHRMIRDVVKANGGQVFSIPRNVMDIAEIDPGSIEVIDTHTSTHLFRADEQLIRATVYRPVYKEDTFGWKFVQTRKEVPALFLSGYDRNEKGLSYFFCELPAGVNPTTVEEAYEALKPPSVKAAEQEGLKVLRQGDMFFIRMKGWQPGDADTHYHGQFIHDSNHIAEDVIWSQGLTYVRGQIVHRPHGRTPDHAPLNLGRTHWWLCVRNTVPIVR